MLRDSQCPKSTVDGEGSQGSAMMSLPQKGVAEQSLVPHLTPELEALADSSVVFLGWSSLASVISKSLVTRMFNWERASTSLLWGIHSFLGATVGNPLHQLSLGFPLSSHQVLSCCPSTTGSVVPVPGPSSHALGPSLLPSPPLPQSPRILYSDISLMLNRCSENVTSQSLLLPHPQDSPACEYSVQGARHGDSVGK